MLQPSSWEFIQRISDPLPHYYEEYGICDYTSVYYTFEHKISSIFLQIHRFHLDFTADWQRIKFTCPKEEFSRFISVLSDKPVTEKEGVVCYTNMLSERNWKSKVEKILSICDGIDVIPFGTRMQVARTLFLNLDHTLFYRKSYEMLSYQQLSIYTFTLALHRWKKEKRLFIPRVIQNKILGHLFPVESGWGRFKEIYPLIFPWKCVVVRDGSLRSLHIGTPSYFIRAWKKSILFNQGSSELLQITIVGISQKLFREVVGFKSFETFDEKGIFSFMSGVPSGGGELSACELCYKKLIRICREKLPISKAMQIMLIEEEEKI